MGFLRLFNCFWVISLGFWLHLYVNPCYSAEPKLEVIYLTHSGSNVLRTWSAQDLEKSGHRTHGRQEWSAQQLLFEQSAAKLELNDRASIDLVTVIAPQKTIRVPRFLIWRGVFVFEWNSRTHSLSSRLKNKVDSRILVPSSYFEVEGIQRIELSNHELTYPGTKLKIRTNPAASRGEKVFVQNCLACHSVSSFGAPSLDPRMLRADRLKSFSRIHRQWPDLKLDPRSERGLLVFAEALALEKNEVKPQK